MLKTHPRCGERQRRRQLDDLPLLHECDGLKRRALAALLQYPLEHLVLTERRDQELPRGFDRCGEELRIGAVGKVLKPSGRIDDVQNRSSSRGTSVSIPLRNPRIFLMGRTGISSIRSS